MSTEKSAPRTYNQVQVPRKYTAGKTDASAFIGHGAIPGKPTAM